MDPDHGIAEEDRIPHCAEAAANDSEGTSFLRFVGQDRDGDISDGGQCVARHGQALDFGCGPVAAHSGDDGGEKGAVAVENDIAGESGAAQDPDFPVHQCQPDINPF